MRGQGNTPPVITAHPQSHYFIAGTTASFSVTASGLEPFVYQWRKNGTNLHDGGKISGATSDRLLLLNVQPSDTGSYSVLVSNDRGSVESYTAFLNIADNALVAWGEALVAWGENSYGQSLVPPAATNLVAIAPGDWHNLGLKADGTMVAWGNWTDVPAELSNVVAIANGESHRLALKEDATVFAWGFDPSGWGTLNLPSGLTNAVAIAAGNHHSLALRADGSVVAWGAGADPTPQFRPHYGQSFVPPGLSGVAAVAAGGFHSVALAFDGSVIAWGKNDYGQTSVPSDLGQVVAIAAGESHTLALKRDGTVVAWGSNYAFNDDPQAVFVGQATVPPDLTGVVMIAAGKYHSLALKSDGTLVAWGSNWREYGVQPAQATVPTGLTNVVAMAGGAYHTLALVGDGSPFIVRQPRSLTVYAGGSATLTVGAVGVPDLRYQWRRNTVNIPGATNSFLTLTNLQLGDNAGYSVVLSNALGGTASAEAVLSVIEGPPIILLPPVRQVTHLGGRAVFRAAAVGSPALTYQWRYEGNDIPGATNAILSLASVSADQAGHYSVRVTNRFGSAESPPAVLSLVQIVAWGPNVDGETLVPTTATNVIAIAAGGTHSLALRNDGTVVAWGENEHGQTDVPPSLSNVVAIAGGALFSLALKSDGTVIAWGSDYYGETDVPPDLTNVVAISAGLWLGLALKADGTVVGWGGVSYSGAPPDLDNVVAISAGEGFFESLAVKADGTVITFGCPPWRDCLLAPQGLDDAVAVAGGEDGEQAMALRASGTVFEWGQPNYGEPLPPDLKHVIAIAARGENYQALKSDGTVVVWGWGPNPPSDLTNVVGIGAGWEHGLALIGEGPPRLTTRLLNRKGILGRRVFFRAEAVGAFPLSYQWKHEGMDIAGETNAILALSNLTFADAGNYSVVLRNAAGLSISDSSTLTIIEETLRIVQPPRSVRAIPGQTVSFSVIAEGTRPFSYQWRKDGTDLVDSPRISGATTDRLLISNVQPSDIGWYSAVVINNQGSVESLEAVLSLADLALVAWGDNTSGQSEVPSAVTNLMAIAPGDWHNLGLKADGTLVAWGNWTNIPVGLSNVVAIANGESHRLALKKDGTVFAWGFGLAINVPSGLANVVAIAAGYYHSLALRADGSVAAWGAGAYYYPQFGADYRQSMVPYGLRGVTAVAAGGFHSVALTLYGTVTAWGNNDYGQTAVPSDLTDVVAIATGESHTLALKRDGTVVAWGSNYAFDEDREAFFAGQATVPADLTDVVAIAAGKYHSLALKSDGTLVAWGSNWRPVFDHDDFYTAQATVPAGLSNVVAMAGGAYHTLALVGDGSPFIVRQPQSRAVYTGGSATLTVGAVGLPELRYQWRRNRMIIPGATNSHLTLTNLQLGDSAGYSVVLSNALGATVSAEAVVSVIEGAPVIVFPPVEQVTHLGGQAVFHAEAEGSAPLTYQWRHEGNDIPGATNATLSIARVSTDQAGHYSVRVSNRFGSVDSLQVVLHLVPVVAWGNNRYGQCDVPQDLTNVVSVAAGSILSLALKADGTVRAWGAGSIPPGLTNVVAITPEMALKSDGTVVAWGDNSHGQTNVPAGLNNVVAIASGNYHRLALTTEGTVVAWGAGTNNSGSWPDHGQSMVPSDLSNVVAIAVSDYLSLALKADGMLVAWGYPTNLPPDWTNVVAIAAGTYPMLVLKSDGTLGSQGGPPPPVGLTNAASLAAGFYHALALKEDGAVVAWGYFSRETESASILPMTVPAGLPHVIGIAAGSGHCLALVGNGSPAVTVQPFSQTLYSGRTLTLRGKAAGSQPLSYQWRFNGVDIPGANHSWLTLSDVQSSAAGAYSLRISNALGTTTSVESVLTVIESPPIVVTPPSNYAYLGEEVVLAVAVDGSLPVSYQWQRNGINIPTATNAFMLLDNVQWNDAGTYTVTVSNAFGLQTSSGTALILTDAPPRIVVHPEGRIAYLGQDLVLQVVAEGSRPFHYQWRFDGIDIPGATNAQLPLSSAARSDVGEYRVVVANALGMATSSNALLRIVPIASWPSGAYGGIDGGWRGAPGVPGDLTNIVAIAGGGDGGALKSDGSVVAFGSAYFRERVSRDLTNVAAIADGLALRENGTVVGWYGQTIGSAPLSNVAAIASGGSYGLAVTDSGTVVALRLVSGPVNNPPEITDVVAVAAGRWYGLALRDNGTVAAWWINDTQTKRLIEISPPPQLNHVVAIAAGGHHALALRDDGKVVAWGDNYYGQTDVPPEATNVVAIAAGEVHSVALRADGTVVVWGWNYSRNTAYVATGLTNVLAISARVYDSLALIGDGWPALTVQPASRKVVSGETARLVALAAGNPPLKFQWLFNGTELPDATNATLELPDVALIQAGDYAVIVSNTMGAMTSRVAQLTVLTPPSLDPLPLTTDVVLGSSVTFTINATGTPPLRYQWRKNGVNIPSATNSWHTITNVQAADGGSYSVVVANIVGSVTSDPMLLIVEVPQVPPGDNFTNRVTVTGSTNSIGGTNRWATREPAEPFHAGKFGSNSMWYSWTAPASGIATFRTVGSTFDTLLGVYVGTNLTDLTSVASDEDRGGYLTSQLQFNAVRDVEYQIAVDGFAGQQGTFILGWDLEPTAEVIPAITNQPVSRTVVVVPGGETTFSVGVSGTDLTYQWLFNGEAIADATNAGLTLTNVTEADVGFYAVWVRNRDGREVESLPAALEIGSVPRWVGVDKLEDLFDESGAAPAPLHGGGKSGAAAFAAPSSGGFISVSMGTIDYQIGSTTNAQSQSWEPNHCGVLGGASVWYDFQAQDAGTLAIDTMGSRFDTVLAVYRRTNLVNLAANNVACDDNSAPDGVRSRVVFETAAGARYWVVVDGVNAARGRVKLNWCLGRAPKVTSTWTNLMVTRGGTVTLQVGVSNAVPAAQYQWYCSGQPVLGATNRTLQLTNLQAAQAGYYSVVVSNAIATVLAWVAGVELEPVWVPTVQHGFAGGGEDWAWGTDAGGGGAPGSGWQAGGYLEVRASHAGGSWWWRAPRHFSGNSASAYRGWLQFDLKQTTGWANRPVVRLLGAGMTLVNRLTSPPGTNWTAFRVSLWEETGWQRADGTPAFPGELWAVLANLEALQIEGQFGAATDACDLDNVQFLAPCTDNPPPLRIELPASPGGTVLAWPAEAGCYQLEATGNLGTSNWTTNFTVVSSVLTNGWQRVTMDSTATNRFFRLKKE